MTKLVKIIASLMLMFEGIGMISAQTTSSPAISDLPILGIAQVTFKVSDLAGSRRFYDGVLGFAEAFVLRDDSGNVTSTYFKVNDDQYIELAMGLQPGELVRIERIAILTSDIEKLRTIYRQRDLNPGAIAEGRDGNPVFRVIGPDGANIDFIQYVAGSRQALARGKYLDARRISTHILHAAVMLKDQAGAAFYRERLGFGDRLPGGRGEYLETPSTDKNLETKNPPLDPENPATLAQYTREFYGAVYHLCLEVPDMRAARDLAQKRAGYDDVRVRAHVGNVRRWLMHLFDPDGSRIEFMETAFQDALPPMTVMAPGAPAAPILPRVPGQISWP